MSKVVVTSENPGAQLIKTYCSKQLYQHQTGQFFTSSESGLISQWTDNSDTHFQKKNIYNNYVCL